MSQTMLQKLTAKTGKDSELQQLHKVVMSLGHGPKKKYQWGLGLTGTTGMKSAAMRVDVSREPHNLQITFSLSLKASLGAHPFI